MAIGARWSLSLNMYPYCIESLDMCFIYGTWCKDGIVNRTKVCVVLYYYLWEKTFQDWTDGASCVIASTYIKILIRNHLNRKFSALPIFSSVISVWPKKTNQNKKKELTTLKTRLACSLQSCSLCTSFTCSVTSSKSMDWWEGLLNLEWAPQLLNLFGHLLTKTHSNQRTLTIWSDVLHRQIHQCQERPQRSCGILRSWLHD